MANTKLEQEVLFVINAKKHCHAFGIFPRLMNDLPLVDRTATREDSKGMTPWTTVREAEQSSSLLSGSAAMEIPRK